jgi:DNA helicase IV
MQWRMLARRGREASWTIVGDLAQRTMPAAPRGWEGITRVLRKREVAVRSLSVNYRTSAQIMDFAARLLPTIAPDQQPPRSPRDSDLAPQVMTGVNDLLVSVADVARHFRRETSGTVAVIAPAGLVEEARPDLADDDVRVLDPQSVRGLEFDAVVVAAPEQIAKEIGFGALYVALTRATERLAIVSAEEQLPGPLAD